LRYIGDGRGYLPVEPVVPVEPVEPVIFFGCMVIELGYKMNGLNRLNRINEHNKIIEPDQLN
jgi:hypothetical protein